jgi:hypothetical protein
MASTWNSRACRPAVAAAVIVLLALGPVRKMLVPEGSLRDNLYSFHEAWGALVLIRAVICTSVYA